jgi:glycogen operon protein
LEHRALKSVTVFLNGEAIAEPDDRGEPVKDDSFFVLFNGHYEPIKFVLPAIDSVESWLLEIDTAAERSEESTNYSPGDSVSVAGRSIVLLRGTPEN